MLKTIFMAGAVAVSAPVLAQQSASPMTPPATTDINPATSAQSDPSTPQGAAVQSAQAIATGTEQIARIVDAEFPAYAKSATGALTRGEFGKWMVALRTASDPSTDPQSAEVQTWIGQAFASADRDNSSSISRQELVGFLSQGQAS